MGYPTLEELIRLEDIANIADENLFTDTVEEIEELWHWTDFVRRDDNLTRVTLVTGGWSGNEEIINTLKGTLFWGAYWESSNRGGEHIFSAPKIFKI